MSETKRELIEVNEKLYSELPEELVKALKEHAPIKLMSSTEVGAALGRSRQWLEWAMKKYPDVIPQPIVDTKNAKSWLATDIIKFKKEGFLTISPEQTTKKMSKK